MYGAQEHDDVWELVLSFHHIKSWCSMCLPQLSPFVVRQVGPRACVYPASTLYTALYPSPIEIFSKLVWSYGPIV